jgi:hypothetical protein
VVAALCVVASSAAIVAGCGGSGASTEASRQCNGSAVLCDRPLNQVVFAATHNSFAGADVPGFRFPEQDAGIPSQLDDGIRGLWIDAYYGIPGNRVYTDTSKINPALNAQLQKQLGAEFTAAADQIRARIAKPTNATPRVYLCHGYCELGAVDAMTAFRQIANFLHQHPDEVLVIDIEDYVTPKDMAELIERSGLGDYVYRGPAGPPWPTLGEMIDSNQRVLVMAEHRTAGAPSWYRRTYDLFQETPFAFRRPSDMSCALNRGRPGNSLFLINNWISTDPKPLKANARIVNAYPFLLARARQCESQRGLVPNAVTVDFYREGGLLRVVHTLNAAVSSPPR